MPEFDRNHDTPSDGLELSVGARVVLILCLAFIFFLVGPEFIRSMKTEAAQWVEVFQ